MLYYLSEFTRNILFTPEKICNCFCNYLCKDEFLVNILSSNKWIVSFHHTQNKRCIQKHISVHQRNELPVVNIVDIYLPLAIPHLVNLYTKHCMNNRQYMYKDDSINTSMIAGCICEF